jgi:hypothetical protein
MIVRCEANSEADEILASLITPPEGFDRGFVLRKQNRSNGFEFELNSFDEYRSKNEAKAIAGAKGGVKSAESRRCDSEAKSKQAPSKPQAKSKQAPSKIEAPDPDPDPDHDHDHDHDLDPSTNTIAEDSTTSKIAVSSSPQESLTRSQLSDLIATDWRWSVHGITPKWSPLAGQLEPFTRAEVEYARREAEAQPGRPSAGLLLRIVERTRAVGPAPPAPTTNERPRSKSKLEEARDADHEITEAYNARVRAQERNGSTVVFSANDRLVPSVSR